jgi:hypothetical protein
MFFKTRLEGHSAETEELITAVVGSVADPDPNPDPTDPSILGLPGSGYGSISQRYGSGSGSVSVRYPSITKQQ